MVRVLVTGSRDWPYPSVVEDELDKLLGPLPLGEVLTVVDGACPTGADFFASQWAARHGWDVEHRRYPADWYKHGKAAGFIRNQEMVDKGADLCLAFCFKNSKGTLDCADRAAKAGIPVRVFHLAIEEYQ